MADQVVLVPAALTPLIILCDGTRDAGALKASFILRTGLRITEGIVSEFLTTLDSAFLLENGAFQQESQEALKRFRQAEFRPPSHQDAVYPADPAELARTIDRYCEGVHVDGDSARAGVRLAGMVCPHIDYDRGNETYAELWQKAAPYLDDVELAIIFGTDHVGGLGKITPTSQSYSTPMGVLPTDLDVVNGLADVLGHDHAFEEELHHAKEHSIELAAVWFHHFIRGRPCPVVPILCGSFYNYVTDEEDLYTDDTINSAIDYLKEATRGRNTLVIAAGDLAHMGPAFGDATSLDVVARAKLTAGDSESLSAICRGDAEGFFQISRSEQDSRRICGLPPIYLTLKYLDGVRGESMGYAQCPADEDGGSVVSIAGVLLYESS